MIYESTNNFSINRCSLPSLSTFDSEGTPISVPRPRYLNLTASHVRSIREDFNDMFAAENQFRTARGDKSIVFILTYRNEKIKYRFGRYVVDGDDLHRFSKSSRLEKVYERAFGYRFDFISVGEYGEGGASHNVVGKRGKGNNPHFHGAGWFHRIGNYDLSRIYTALLSIEYPCVCGIDSEYFVELYSKSLNIDTLLYDWMIALLRFEWQKNNCCSIVEMSKSAVTPDGLGFCKLDGEIQFDGASSYLSKYMGKDMLNWHNNLVTQEFGKELYSLLMDLLVTDLHFPSSTANYLIGLWNKKEKVGELDPFLNKNPFGFCPTLDKYNVSDIFKIISRHYEDFILEFESDVCRYSPKLRHFRGFGYSLLDSSACNKRLGTYRATRKRGDFVRPLPPSLQRHLYYDYHEQISVDNCKNYKKKIVKYVLNDLGREHLSVVLRNNVKRDITLASIFEDGKYKHLAKPLSIFLNCIFPYRFLDGCYFPFSVLYDIDDAVSYGVMCRQEYVGIFAREEQRKFINPLNALFNIDSELYEAFLAFYDYKTHLRKISDDKSALFLSHWSNVYLNTY